MSIHDSWLYQDRNLETNFNPSSIFLNCYIVVVTTYVCIVVLGRVKSYQFCRSINAPSFVLCLFISVFQRFSLVSGLGSLGISLWYSTRRFSISDVISSFREALKRSKKLPSILGDFVLDGPTTLTSWSKRQEFSTTTGEKNLHLHFQ